MYSAIELRQLFLNVLNNLLKHENVLNQASTSLIKQIIQDITILDITDQSDGKIDLIEKCRILHEVLKHFYMSSDFADCVPPTFLEIDPVVRVALVALLSNDLQSKSSSCPLLASKLEQWVPGYGLQVLNHAFQKGNLKLLSELLKSSSTVDGDLAEMDLDNELYNSLQGIIKCFAPLMTKEALHYSVCTIDSLNTGTDTEQTITHVRYEEHMGTVPMLGEYEGSIHTVTSPKKDIMEVKLLQNTSDYKSNNMELECPAGSVMVLAIATSNRDGKFAAGVFCAENDLNPSCQKMIDLMERVLLENRANGIKELKLYVGGGDVTSIGPILDFIQVYGSHISDLSVVSGIGEVCSNRFCLKRNGEIELALNDNGLDVDLHFPNKPSGQSGPLSLRPRLSF